MQLTLSAQKGVRKGGVHRKLAQFTRKARELKLSNGERFSGTPGSANQSPALIRTPSATKLHLVSWLDLVGSSILGPYPVLATLVFMLHSYSKTGEHCYLGLFAAKHGGSAHESATFKTKNCKDSDSGTDASGIYPPKQH